MSCCGGRCWTGPAPPSITGVLNCARCCSVCLFIPSSLKFTEGVSFRRLSSTSCELSGEGTSATHGMDEESGLPKPSSSSTSLGQACDGVVPPPAISVFAVVCAIVCRTRRSAAGPQWSIAAATNVCEKRNAGCDQRSFPQEEHFETQPPRL